MKFEFSAFVLEIRFSFFAVLALMLLLCDERVALLCFAASLLHECGHLAAMALFGCKLRAVCFGAAGIAIERKVLGGVSPFGEACIALGGVAVNLLLCAFSLPFALFGKYFAGRIFVFSNGALALLNLLPVYPLDAARALEAILQPRISPEKADALLRRISLASTAFVLLAGVIHTFYFSWNVSLFALCVYVTALNLKRSTTDV